MLNLTELFVTLCSWLIWLTPFTFVFFLAHTVREVVFQPRQFVCAMETVGGEYNAQNIYNMSLEQVHWDVAEWAMAGNRLTNLGFALWFYNPFSVTCRDNFPSRVGEFVIRIGDHCFYNPTPAYAET